MPLVPGQILKNRYRIAKLLAQGGFGAVYRAWDLNLNNAVALKENLTTSPESLKQFTTEARLLANLRQENLPYVIDHFSVPGQGQYLVMEFVEGKDLQSMLDEGGPLAESQVITWFSQVCNALGYLHSQTPAIIHRDIKPANIKITPKGQVMLVDFGIAKVYDPSGRTTVGARAVTQGFSPPEQYGTGRTDARSDIYALGATLFAALTGQTPLDSLQRRLGNPLTPPRQINLALSPSMEQVILRAMELDPVRRYASVREFRSALTASMLNPAVVHRAAPVIPQTQVAASSDYGGPDLSAPSTPQNFPATMRMENATPAPEPVYQPRPQHGVAPEREVLSQRGSQGRARRQASTGAGKTSRLLLFGVIAILLLGVLGVVGGAVYYFSSATPTSTPARPDMAWATQTMQALITLQTKIPTNTFARSPTPIPETTTPPTWTPSATTLPPSWTPISTFTPTLSPTPVPNLQPTWYPCSGTYPSRLHVGDRAFVSSDPPLSNRVRSQPNTTSEVLGYLEVSEKMEILEGPVCFGGWIWWRVRSLEKNLTGWTAEGDATAYWLVPLP
jgi:eukaryotic-like serine/threonine-protein kinase